MKVVRYAVDAFRSLNGFFCVYKPAGLCIPQIRGRIAGNLARDLNDLETRPPRDRVVIKGSVQSGQPMIVKLEPNLADHVAVVGPRYQPQDIQVRNVCYLTRNMSGVLVMAVNDACRKVGRFRSKNHVQVIEIKGKFGYATDTFFEDGKVLEKATYAHINEHKVNRTISSIQATHQAEAFQHAGVRLDSQAAYELASKGPIRPEGETPPILHSINCVDISLPYFTLKIHCTNTTEEYLSNLIHQIGLYLKSCAVCCHIRQIQFNQFTLEHSLLRKHWTLEHIISNSVLCKKILGPTLLPPIDPHFKAVDKSTVKKAVQEMQEEALWETMKPVNEIEVANEEELSLTSS